MKQWKMRNKNTIEIILDNIGRFIVWFIKTANDATTPIYHSTVSEKNRKRINKQKRNKQLAQIKGK
jgi:hypothetical protein